MDSFDLVKESFERKEVPAEVPAGKTSEYFGELVFDLTHDMPCFGICLGMQMMVIEFASDVLGLADADSCEMNPKTPHNVIDLMEDQKSITQMGGAMRLGEYPCQLRPGSRVAEAYGGQESIRERHRHRYEFNNRYRKDYEKAGMQCVGINPDADLMEIVEIPEHRWYIGTQFHPEYSSSVLHPHPLFMSFVKACIAQAADLGRQ